MSSSDVFEFATKAIHKYYRIGEESPTCSLKDMCTGIRDIFRKTQVNIVPCLLFLDNLNVDFGDIDIVSSFYFGYAFILNTTWYKNGQIFCSLILHTYEFQAKSVQANIYFGTDDEFNGAKSTWMYAK